MELDARDRVLVFAPHPDDESIATGGLLQAAGAAGASRRLVVMTDGDNNPWPQRWIEKRWFIGARERARWGARRREEAHAAMRLLGVPEGEAQFLGLPDLGLTDLLMRADPAVIATLRGILEAFAPTLLALPALSDRHPDHSAAHVLVRLALARSNAPVPHIVTFAVHGGGAMHGDVAVVLDAAQRDRKRAAILAHETQMQFSRSRFVRFARRAELYRSVLKQGADAQHPLRARIEGDALTLRIAPDRWGASLARTMLFVALETTAGSTRWRIPVPERGARTIVLAGAGDAAVGEGTSTHAAGEIVVSIPWSHAALQQGYAKLSRPEPGWRVFDRYGWQPVA